MKLFKRLLAVALIGVMALTFMTACTGNPNADDAIPSDQVVVYEAYNKLLEKAPLDGYSANVKYSRILSGVAEQMRVAVYSTNYRIDGELSSDCEMNAKDVFNKAVENGTLPKGSVLCVGYLPTNPAYVGADNFNYANLYSQPDFENANTVGIVYNGSALMIVAAYIPKTSK